MHEIIDPLSATGKKRDIKDVLIGLASQENCDGEPYDQMMEAARYIEELERAAYATIPECEDKAKAKAVLDKAVWCYIEDRHWALVAEDGEILAEVVGSEVKTIYRYKGKPYFGYITARKAAVAELRKACE